MIIASLILLAVSTGEKFQIEGFVRSSDDAASSVIRDARVYVYTARPRKGTSPFCPSCYPDCQKQTRTDGSGHFAIPAQDSSLIFRLLVVAEDHEPLFVEKVDPKEKPISVRLKRRDLGAIPHERISEGVIHDGHGKPISGATIKTVAVVPLTKGASTSTDLYADPLAVTDELGKFRLTASAPNVRVYVLVSARGHAPRHGVFVAGMPSKTFELEEGATVLGRLTNKGKPVPNIAIRLVQVNTSPDRYFGSSEVGTDENGQFTFSNVSTDEEYFVYPTMQMAHSFGAVPPVKTRVKTGIGQIDIGDIELRDGLSVQGTVKLSDGKAIPEATRVVVWIRDTGDAQEVELDEKGTFSLVGLPPTVIKLAVTVRGYRLSRRNPSLSPIDLRSVAGTLTESLTGFTVLLEPGVPEEVDSEKITMKEFEEERRPLQTAR